MTEDPLWKQFIVGGTLCFLLGVLVLGAGLAAAAGPPAVLVIGLLFVVVGALVLHAGLIGAVLVGPNGVMVGAHACAAARSEPDESYPEGIRGIIAYLQKHPRSTVEDVARAVGSSPSAVYSELAELRASGKAKVDGRARWSLLE